MRDYDSLKKDFKNKKVLIMGLGLLGGGVGSARFFANLGAKVTVTDLKSKEKLFLSIKKLANLPINYVFGDHREKDFLAADLIIRNPDVLPSSPYLEIARKHKIPIEMAESFFVKNCPSLVIGITGSRGKSTVASLVAHILKEAGLPVFLAGNIAGCSTLLLFEKITPKTYVVLELSSFQLEAFSESKISPQIALITNIYPEHLNHYPAFKNYIDDKKNIFRFQAKNDFLILNKRCKYTKEFKKKARSKVFLFDRENIPSDWDLKLKGEHNRENVAAATIVAQILKISPEIIQKAVESFNPLPYRLEKVREINGVSFINDGVSTSPEATMAALSSFKKPVILLLGGNDKKLDFGELGQFINKKAKAVFLMEGTATEKIKKVIKKELIGGSYPNLAETLLAAKKAARTGDIILFSPAATSFNWFNNVYHRSSEFEKIVKRL